jgi:hypothetical protein
MSKTKVSASAIGLPSRRLFLASGPAAAVLTSLRKAAAKESPIQALIEEHRQAVAVFEVAFHASDAAMRFGPESDEYRRAAEEHTQNFFAMEAVFLKLCAEPARSLAEARMKAAYVLDLNDDLDHTMGALLRSFAS